MFIVLVLLGSNEYTYISLSFLVDGGWSMWGNWSSCSSTCGVATKTRTRTCSHPPPQNGGAQCPGNQTQMHACFDRACPGIDIYMYIKFVFRFKDFRCQYFHKQRSDKILVFSSPTSRPSHILETLAVRVVFKVTL